MVQIALVFVGIAIVVCLMLLVGAVYFIPRVLADVEHGESQDGHEGQGGHAG